MEKIKVCPNCKKEGELYRICYPLCVNEDIYIYGVLKDGSVNYSVEPPEMCEDFSQPDEYRCSFCQHSYTSDIVDDIYFKEMIEGEKDEM